MRRKFVIGLDFGTKSGRALLADAKTGECVAQASRDYSHGVMDAALPDGTALGPDWALQHPQDYIEVLEATIPGVLRQSGAVPEDVVGLSIDFTACTPLPVDVALTPLCFHGRFKSSPHAYVKLWKHHAAAEQTRRINELLEQRGSIGQPRYGGKVSSELLLPKLLQVLDEAPDVFDAADQFLESADWLCQLLTGETRRSASFAAYKAWWQEGEGYPDEVFAALDQRLARLGKTRLRGEVCPVGGAFGALTAAWAGRLGLLPGTAVGCGIIDSHAGIPGCGITRPGQMLLIAGTSSVQAALSEQPYSGGGIMGAVKNGVIPGYYALESGLAGVGDVFEWFILNGVPAEYAAGAKAAGKNIYRYLADRTSHYRAGQSGLLALDWLSGNKTPFVDSGLSGLILGLTLATKPEEIYRALVEATGFGTRLIMEHFENAGVKISEIVACGGIAEKDPFLMQIYADITNREIKVSASEQTAALGAAVYASVATGAGRGGYDTVPEAARAMSRLREQAYRPDRANAEIYSWLYAKYKETGAFFGEQNDVMKLLRGLR